MLLPNERTCFDMLMKLSFYTIMPMETVHLYVQCPECKNEDSSVYIGTCNDKSDV